MAYLDDERRTLLAFALCVYTNTEASPAEREAARRRLTADTREADMSKLTDAQLTELTNAMRVANALLVVARGGAYVAPEVAPMPFVPRPIDARSEPANASTNAPGTIAPISTPEPIAELTAPRTYTLAAIKALLPRP